MSELQRKHECRQCKRVVEGETVKLDYGKDDLLHFCSKRCRLDWLDGLPSGSIILENHKDTPEVTPWNAREQ